MKKYLSFMYGLIKGQRLRYVIVLIILFFSVFLSLISTYLIKIVVDCFSVTNGIPDIKDPELLGPIGILLVQMFGGADHLLDHRWLLALAVILCGVLLALSNIIRGLMRAYITSAVSARMRKTLFEHIERMPYEDLKKLSNGDLLQTCMRDEAVLRRFIGFQFMGLCYTADMIIVSFVILISINWKVALVAMALLPVLFIYSVIVLKYVRKRYRAADDAEAVVTGKIEENINSIRVVKAYNNERHEIDEFGQDIDRYAKKFIHWRKLSSFYFSSSDIFVFAEIIITSLFAATLCLKGEITVGTVILASSLTSMVVWPVRQTAQIMGDFTRAIVAIDRMNMILDHPMEDIDSGLTPTIKGGITFEHAGFRFKDGKDDAIHDLNLTIAPGSTVAVMGRTGCGKSTLALLLNRLYDYDSGSIKIDGVELKDISRRCIRENVAAVLQEPFIFSRTILQNLKIAQHDAETKKVHEATRIAAIHDDILGFEKGYDTIVGERGTTLSGGQKQRLAMARTLLNEAPIMIFDDSLSAVDTETDIKIRKALKERSRSATTIIITHRIMTAKDADQIIIMEDGTIKDHGTHEELIKKDGFYKLVWQMQARVE